MTRQENTKKLIEASRNGHMEEVKKWLPISDPKANDNESLRWACDYNNQELFDVLYPVSEPEKALEWMKIQNGENQIWDTVLLEERLKSEHEKKKIQKVLQKTYKNMKQNQKKMI